MIEFAGVLTGVLAVWLTTRQNIWCWPVGIVSVALFVLVFFQARLYAAMGLQVAYVALSGYGWYSWARGGPEHGSLRVGRVATPVLAGLLVAGAAAGAGLGSWLAFRTNAAVPWVDAPATAYSLVAQFMQTRKWIETWLLWIVIDVVYVAMYLSQGLALTASLYAMYLLLAVLGWREWRRSLVTRS